MSTSADPTHTLAERAELLNRGFIRQIEKSYNESNPSFTQLTHDHVIRICLSYCYWYHHEHAENDRRFLHYYIRRRCHSNLGAIDTNGITDELAQIMYRRFEHMVDRGFLAPHFLAKMKESPSEIWTFIRQNRAVVGERLIRTLNPSIRPTIRDLEDRGIIPRGHFQMNQMNENPMVQLPGTDNAFNIPQQQEIAFKNTHHLVENALKASDLGQYLSENVCNLIMKLLKVSDIYFCSHNGAELIAFNIDGDYLGTMVKTVEDEHANEHDQWLTGFDFDSKGTLYVALRIGLISKYQIPSDQTPFCSAITPRTRDEQFDRTFHESLRQLLNGADEQLYPEGLRVVENGKYQCILMTVMEPLNGILQISFDGTIARVIARGYLEQPWSLEVVPPFFVKDLKSPFLKDRLLVMVADRKRLVMIDVERGEVMSCLKFVDGSNSAIGDFTFVDPLQNGKAMLLVNLENGLFQCHQCEMFWKLKSFNLNEFLDKFNDLEGVIEESYGTSIGPDGAVYFSDHDNDRIIRMNVDWNFISNSENFDEKMTKKWLTVTLFAEGMHEPNYSQWFKAADIGLDFVCFPEEEFKE